MRLDKRLHFAAGVGIAAVVGFAFDDVLVGVLAAFVAGVLKEVLDYAANFRRDRLHLPRTHDVEALDFAYTAAGGALVGLAMFLATHFGGV